MSERRGGQTSVGLRETDGWACWRDRAAAGWFKGYLNARDRTYEGREAARFLLSQIGDRPTERDLEAVLGDADGQFAVVIETGRGVLAATDRIRSIPLFYAADRDGYRIDSSAPRLQKALGLHAGDPDAALECAMAGYCLGQSTLYRGLKQLQSGELAWFADDGRGPDVRRYYAYRPWARAESGPLTDGHRRRLRETTRAVFEKMVAGLEGRPVMLPLSAGLDSRLVASALHELGVKDVHCYAYGLPGNFEAEASRQISDRLGYSWRFYPHSNAIMRDLLGSRDFGDYWTGRDTCAAVPSIQDILALREMRDRKEVPSDAVFINGNTGDFITGGHIPKPFWQARPKAPATDRLEAVFDAQLDKHFSLWRHLRGASNDAYIKRLLGAAGADDAVLHGPPETDFGICEALEYQERQAKFVVNGQRIYDHFGYAWRLPLWDREFVDFWETMPLEAKREQRLYREFLERENMGGVWRDQPVNATTIRPAWLRAVRGMAKLFATPLGKRAWRRFDLRVFAYWTDNISGYAMLPYGQVLRENRGFRNIAAIHTLVYLREKGLFPEQASPTAGDAGPVPAAAPRPDRQPAEHQGRD